MNLDVHDALLRTGARMKVQALGLLGLRDPNARFQAAVLLHEAALQEVRAVDAVLAPPASARLAVLAEACGCFLRGFDPVLAAIYWGKLLEAGEQALPEVVVRADDFYRELREHLVAEQAEYRAFVERRRALFAVLPARGLQGLGARDRQGLRRLLDEMLARFPGVSGLWSYSGHLAWHEGDHLRAWQESGRAMALRPWVPGFSPAPWRLGYVAEGTAPVEEGADLLEQLYADRHEQDAETLVMLALAELKLARDEGLPHARLRRAEEAARLAGCRPTQVVTQSLSNAVGQIVRAYLEGGRPGVEVLYRAGLGPYVQPGVDPLDSLIDLSSRQRPLPMAA